MNSRRIVAVIRWVLSFLFLAAIVFVYHRWLNVNPTTVALTLLLFVLAVASQWSQRLAIVLSIVSAFCFNFFFLPPFGTLSISDPENWLALFTFLATALIGSHLSQRARQQAEDARIRQYELETLLYLSRELLQTENVAELTSIVPSIVVTATLARSCVLYLLEEDRFYQAGPQISSALELPDFRNQALSLNSVQTIADMMRIPLRSGVKPRGLLIITGARLFTETAEALGGLVSIALDRARALENIAHSEANKESERLRTLMIDSITHELRTPLTAIKGAATTLLDETVLDAETQHELLTIIDEECDRIDRLAGQAAEMAQLETEAVQMHLENLQVSEIVAAALEDCGSLHDHPVSSDVRAELVVTADREFLQKVLANLLENAAKYSPAGSPITVSAEAKGSYVAISVADRGIGIEPNEQALIFDRFYRAPVHNQRIPGTGMGLSISKAIVEKLGGTLTVVSQPGSGSVFTFTVPSASTHSRGA